MILCIDIGNTQIHMGVFEEDSIVAQFRYGSTTAMSSDQFGIFLKMALAEKAIDWKIIQNISVCSVVPELDYSVRAACIKYFHLNPFFLVSGVKTGLNIKYSRPSEIGADRIATAIGGTAISPDSNLIIVDMGTATTVCAITKNKEYLAGAILPGIKSSLQSLCKDTAKLPSVEIVKPSLGLGKSTKDNIQLGIFYGQLGAIRAVIAYIATYAFEKSPYTVVGTGGFSELFKDEDLFNIIIPELALIGLSCAFKLNG